MNAIPLQGYDVAAGRLMFPHSNIHGWCGEHGFIGCEKDRGGEIVGEAIRHAGQKICRGRRHNDQVSIPGELDMSDLGFIVKIEQVGETFLLGER